MEYLFFLNGIFFKSGLYVLFCYVMAIFFLDG